MSDTDEKLDDLVEQTMKELRPLIRKALEKNDPSLYEIETEVDDIGQSIKEVLTKRVINKIGKRYAGTRTDCRCGARAKYSGDRVREMTTLHGRIKILRAYYYCDVCRSGWCPTDAILKLGSGGCSKAVQCVVARVCSYLPFAKATQEIAALRRVSLSPTTVQHYAKEIGQHIGEEWTSMAEQYRSGKTISSGLAPKRLYKSMDAVKVHVGGRWRDAKLGTTYQRQSDGRVVMMKHYASLETARDFGPKMLMLVHVSGGDNCDDQEFVADGGEWIWRLQAKYFPTDVQALDFYHLTEHLWVFANTKYGQETKQGKVWMGEQITRLLNDEAPEVVKEMLSWQPNKKTQKEIRRKAICYMQTHASRTNYKTLRDNGYHIGSGVEESACKRVVKARIGGAGMRWEEPGVSAVMNLAAYWNASGRCEFAKYVN